MKDALLKAGFKPSPHFKLEKQLDYMRLLVKKGKFNEAEIVRLNIVDFCVVKRLKLPDEIRNQQ